MAICSENRWSELIAPEASKGSWLELHYSWPRRKPHRPTGARARVRVWRLASTRRVRKYSDKLRFEAYFSNHNSNSRIINLDPKIGIVICN